MKSQIAYTVLPKDEVQKVNGFMSIRSEHYMYNEDYGQGIYFYETNKMYTLGLLHGHPDYALYSAKIDLTNCLDLYKDEDREIYLEACRELHNNKQLDSQIIPLQYINAVNNMFKPVSCFITNCSWRWEEGNLYHVNFDTRIIIVYNYECIKDLKHVKID